MKLTWRQKTWASAALLSMVLVASWTALSSDAGRRWLLAPDDFERARLHVPHGTITSTAGVGRLRAFYSGHSLSDGVPEEVVRIAASKGKVLEFDVESLPGSLIKKRVQHRASSLPRGRYDVQVVTERHDLPYTARFENTAGELRRLHEALSVENPHGTTFFYHTWLEIDLDDPAQFVSYEREALALWECVASAVNRELPGPGRVRVLPGGSALAELVERLARGELEGAPGATPRERVQLLFADHVHMTSAARYFMGAVHYAGLFGESPEGAALPASVSAELGAALQRLAAEHVSAYAARAQAAAARDMSVCRDFATHVMCPLFAAHPRAEPLEHPLQLWRRKRRCQAGFADPGDPDNPFRDGAGMSRAEGPAAP